MKPQRATDNVQQKASDCLGTKRGRTPNDVMCYLPYDSDNTNKTVLQESRYDYLHDDFLFLQKLQDCFK